jgi:Tfp pilus assembly protein PilN
VGRGGWIGDEAVELGIPKAIMKTIDFLPDIYRQREALRRARIWWGCVVVIFSTAIAASALAQAWLRHNLHQQLDSLAPEYAQAQSQVQELTGLQAQSLRAGHEASLYTFLENPWPRTQLLAEIVRPLPESIRLTQIHIAEEEPARSAIQAGPRNAKAEEEAAARATPPEQDLARLQDENGRRQTTIEIDGHTTDVERLHKYLESVSSSPLIAAANIKSLEAAAANQQGRTRFTLRVVIRPGYCQRASDMPPLTARAPPAATAAPGGGG